eukprot:1375729-Rhodomonas_salina.2
MLQVWSAHHRRPRVSSVRTPQLHRPPTSDLTSDPTTQLLHAELVATNNRPRNHSPRATRKTLHFIRDVHRRNARGLWLGSRLQRPRICAAQPLE